MSKKQPITRFSKATSAAERADAWHNGSDLELHLYSRSLQTAAQTLLRHLGGTQSPQTALDAWPIIFLYRQSLELHLKSLVGEGSNFLASRTDPISLYRTHSLRWLAQIVCQTIKTVGWENEFTCDGVASLIDFSAFIDVVESLDPVTRAVQSGAGSSWSQHHQTFGVVLFAKRMDALLDLLDVTADALAAAWDLRSEALPDEQAFHAGGDTGDTTQ